MFHLVGKHINLKFVARLMVLEEQFDFYDYFKVKEVPLTYDLWYLLVVSNLGRLGVRSS